MVTRFGATEARIESPRAYIAWGPHSEEPEALKHFGFRVRSGWLGGTPSHYFSERILTRRQWDNLNIYLLDPPLAPRAHDALRATCPRCSGALELSALSHGAQRRSFATRSPGRAETNWANRAFGFPIWMWRTDAPSPDCHLAIRNSDRDLLLPQRRQRSHIPCGPLPRSRGVRKIRYIRD